MIGEIVAIMMLLVGVAIFGGFAWRFSLRLIGLDRQELALWSARFRNRPTAEDQPMPAPPGGLDERVERVLALLEDKPRQSPTGAGS